MPNEQGKKPIIRLTKMIKYLKGIKDTLTVPLSYWGNKKVFDLDREKKRRETEKRRRSIRMEF